MPIKTHSEVFCEDIASGSWDKIPDLSLDTAEIWKISIKDALHQQGKMFQLLSHEEQIRTLKYHQAKDQARFTIGKGFLRKILALYMGGSPTDISFKEGINHKPFVEHWQPLEFNVSYSGNLIIIGVSSRAVGVDVEYIRPDFDYLPLMDICFMEKEVRMISSSPDSRRYFFKFWTRKEALLKVTALGLGDYLTDFSCLDGRQSMPRHLGGGKNWFVKSYLLNTGYWVSLAQDSALPVRLINPDYLATLD